MENHYLRTLICTVFIASAYTVRESNAGELSSDKGAIQFLTTENTIDDWPCFSPDGKSVLFSRSTDGGKSWELFVVPTSGGRATRFVQSALALPVAATRAAWSKIDNRIAFTGVSPEGYGTLWFVDAAGVKAYAAPSIPGLTQIYYPAWISSRELVVMDANEFVLRVIDTAAGRARPITDKTLIFAGRAGVSADGKKVAFAGQRNEGQHYDQEKNSIWLIEGRKAPRLLEATALQGRSPDWSPDGARIVFESNRLDGHRYAIFIAEAVKGERVQQITDGKFDAYHPGWSPRGNQIVFSARREDSGEVVNIAVINAP